MKDFFENPLVEKRLSFDFGDSQGATRYEKWPSHIETWQNQGRKAVDFIYADVSSKTLFFTEVKDFIRIDKKSETYGDGTYSANSQSSCEITALDELEQKYKDSIHGFETAINSADADEKSFSLAYKNYSYRIILHWEFKQGARNLERRQLQMALMKTKLRMRLQGVCTHVFVENMQDAPSKYWTVHRLGRKRL